MGVVIVAHVVGSITCRCSNENLRDVIRNDKYSLLYCEASCKSVHYLVLPVPPSFFPSLPPSPASYHSIGWFPYLSHQIAAALSHWRRECQYSQPNNVHIVIHSHTYTVHFCLSRSLLLDSPHYMPAFKCDSIFIITWHTTTKWHDYC